MSENCMAVAYMNKILYKGFCFFVLWPAGTWHGSGCSKNCNIGFFKDCYERSLKLFTRMTSIELITFILVLMTFTDLLSRWQWIPKIMNSEKFDSLSMSQSDWVQSLNACYIHGQARAPNTGDDFTTKGRELRHVCGLLLAVKKN